MLTLSVGTLLEVVRGELLHGSDSVVVNGIAIDSRKVHPGAAFVAFRGETDDGVDHVSEALAAGARAVLLDHGEEEALQDIEASGRRDAALVRVSDPLHAVQALARYHRLRLTCPVVGLTGSTGKTSTKDLLEAVLSTTLRVVASELNQNNELGVPLTIMRAGADTDALVVEMAMRAPGQISELCEIALPTLGLVTNVGQAHIESLGSQEAIVDAKAELVESVPEGGQVFLNGDDELSQVLGRRTRAQVTLYGEGEGNRVRFAELEVDDLGRPSFDIVTEEGTRRACLPVPGRHNAYNAVAAAAVGLYLGLTLEDVVAGLESATVSGMRMETFVNAVGVTIVNDAYNANPTSMKAALATLRDVRPEGRRIAVLGDMAELGSLSELAHFKLGEQAACSGLDILVTVGRKARRIAEGALAEGMPREKMLKFDDAEEAAGPVSRLVAPGDVVLVKASRVMELERIVEGMTKASG